MPYTTISSQSDGNILSASYLNTLSNNQEFLFGLANQANAPFNSFRATVGTLDRDNMEWWGRHRLQYLHWKLTSQGGSWEYARVYMNGVKVGGDEGAHTTFSGYYDMTTWAGLPNLLGAWVTSHAYDDDVNGDGSGGNGDDGDVVTQSGSYYRCKLAHTSGAGNQPGIGGSWTTYWDLLTLPNIGDMFQVWADINFSGSTETTVEYILEADASSL